jgi:hypothetical protein
LSLSKTLIDKKDGKDLPVDAFDFDFANNITEKNFELVDIDDFEQANLEDYALSKDLVDLTNKGYLSEIDIPLSMKVEEVSYAGSKLVSIDPSFDDVKRFLTYQYNNLVKILSSFKKSAKSGKFNLFYKILLHWEKQDYMPEYQKDYLDIEDVLQVHRKSEFKNTIIAQIEEDYNELLLTISDLDSLAQQMYRNREISMTSKPG